jgi:Leucine-rich repeat (LRR) protein
MYMRLIVLISSVSLLAISTFCGCGTANMPVDPDQVLSQLRTKYPDKSDNEIIQMLHGYIAGDKSTVGNERNWFEERLQWARDQREKGQAQYIYAKSSSPSSVPAWLRQIMGGEFFLAVDTLYVGQGGFTDEQLKHLQAFPELRELHLSGCFPENTDSGLKYLEGLTELQELSLNRQQEITDAGLAHIKNLISLRKLDLSYTKITDAGLQHLDNLLNLESLDLSKTQVTDAGVTRLARFSKLESLNINYTKATEAVLVHIKDWPNLKHFIHSFPLSDQGLELLSRFPRLRKPEDTEYSQRSLLGVTDDGLSRTEAIGKPSFLGIYRSHIKTGWKHLEQIPSIEHLHIRETEVNPEGMAAISGLPKLRSFNLNAVKITGGWECIAQMKSLQSIQSTATEWPAEGLKALSQNKNNWIEGRIAKSDGMTLSTIGTACGPDVHELFLYPDEVGLNFEDCHQYPQYMRLMIDCLVADRDMEVLPDFRNVKLLEIDDESLATAALPYIQALTQLEELRLCCPMAFPSSGTRAPEREKNQEHTTVSYKPGMLFEALRDPTPLKHLKGLAINVPSDEHLAFVAKLPQLECLRLYHDHNVTDAGLKHLKGLRNLKELCLTGTKITDAGLEQLKSLKGLRWLYLDRTQVSDTGVQHFKELSNLEWLHVVHTQVTDKGVKKLKQSLPDCHIWWDDPPINDPE